MYQKMKCRARIHVADDKIVKILKEHNHLFPLHLCYFLVSLISHIPVILSALCSI